MSNYIVKVSNADDDNKKKISGTIDIVITGPKKKAVGQLSGLPNPWTNPTTNLQVNQSEMTITGNELATSSITDDLMTDNMLVLLSTEILNVYGINLTLIKEVTTPKSSNNTELSMEQSIDNREITSPTQSKIDDIFTFNVMKDGVFMFTTNLSETIGELIIEEGFNFTDNELDESFLLEGTLESEFAGTEEELISLDGEVDAELANAIKGDDPENPDQSLTTDTYPISNDVDYNIKQIIKIAKQSGITNKFSISAMIAISKKESGIKPRSESSYAKTPAARIKKIFSKFRNYSDSEVDRIKKSPKEFFDIIYGGKYGNSSTEGFKYRGRGLNQITFKGNYQKYKELSKYDIVRNPDLLNTIDVAAKCLVEYFKNNFSKAPNDIKDRYNFKNINSFTNLTDATGAFYHANAGWGKSYSEVVADSTGGRKKAFSYVKNIYETYKDQM